MKRALIFSIVFASSACFTGWKSDGPWACEAGTTCPDGFTCDDGVCCKPGGTPACPTLPFENTCPEGRDAKNYFNDADGDGVGWTASGRPFCRAPQQGGWVELSGDCNDADATVGPRANERCNAQDDNCDGVIDDGLANQRWYRDADGDGFGDNCPTCQLMACVKPEGYVSRAGDCDDANDERFPGADERCNGVDDNCNDQLDDAPFVDVENPSDPNTTRFPCNTALLGQCSSGGMQCVYSPTTERFEPRCVPYLQPQPEVCGDMTDNDCDGTVDAQPGCGGPRNVFTGAGVAMGAYVIRDEGAALPGTIACRGKSGTEAMAWLRPSWIGTGAGVHVLYAEAPVGQPWDLRGASTLRMNLVTTAVAGSAGLWNEPNRAPSVVVYLCGENNAMARRYVPEGGQRLMARYSGAPLMPVPNVLEVPLQNPMLGVDGGWTASSTSTFDMRAVHRIELHATPEDDVDITFTNRFSSGEGGLGFFP
ncbi:MAG: putative metal-binding motif-containing protein [Archangium sp.]